MILTWKNNVESFSLAGGKGLNLKKMIDKGIPVPEFIVLTDDVFKLFLEQNNLTETIKTIKDAKSDSIRIEKLIMEGTVPSELMDHIQRFIPRQNEWHLLRFLGLMKTQKITLLQECLVVFIVKGHEELNTSIKNVLPLLLVNVVPEYRIKNKLPMNSINL